MPLPVWPAVNLHDAIQSHGACPAHCLPSASPPSGTAPEAPEGSEDLRDWLDQPLPILHMGKPGPKKERGWCKVAQRVCVTE